MDEVLLALLDEAEDGVAYEPVDQALEMYDEAAELADSIGAATEEEEDDDDAAGAE